MYFYSRSPYFIEQYRDMYPVRDIEEYANPLHPPLYPANSHTSDITNKMDSDDDEEEDSDTNNHADSNVDRYLGKDWPTKEECDTWVKKFPQWNEFPTVFLPAENKGYQLVPLLNEVQGLYGGKQHDMPWYPPVCVSLVDVPEGGETTGDSLYLTARNRKKLKLVDGDVRMKQFLLSYIRTYDGRLISTEEEMGQRLLTALKESVGPRWAVFNLAGLYWRVIGQSYHAVECIRRSLHLAPHHVRDVPLLNLANIMYLNGEVDDALAATMHAYDINSEEPLTNFFLGSLLAARGNLSGSVYHYRKALDKNSSLEGVVDSLRVSSCYLKQMASNPATTPSGFQHMTDSNAHATCPNPSKMSPVYTHCPQIPLECASMLASQVPHPQMPPEMEPSHHYRCHSPQSKSASHQTSKDSNVNDVIDGDENDADDVNSNNNNNKESEVEMPKKKPRNIPLTEEHMKFRFQLSDGSTIGVRVHHPAAAKNPTTTDTVDNDVSDKDNAKVSDKDNAKVSDKDNAKVSDKDNAKVSDKDNAKVSDKDNEVPTADGDNVRSIPLSVNGKDIPELVEGSEQVEDLADDMVDVVHVSERCFQGICYTTIYKENKKKKSHSLTQFTRSATEYMKKCGGGIECEKGTWSSWTTTTTPNRNRDGDAETSESTGSEVNNLKRTRLENLQAEDDVVDDDPLPDVLLSASKKVKRLGVAPPIPTQSINECRQFKPIDLTQFTSTWLSFSAKHIDINDYIDFSPHGDNNKESVISSPTCDTNLVATAHTLDHLKGVSNRASLHFSPERGLQDVLLTLTGFTDVSNVPKIGNLLARSLKQNSTSWIASTTAALYWRVVGNAKHAIDCLRHALNYAPHVNKDIPLVNLANVLHRSDYLHDAIITTNLALDISPNLVVIHFTMANIYAAKGNMDMAEEFYESTLALQSTFEPAKSRLKTILCDRLGN